jgi:hypothetical protein
MWSNRIFDEHVTSIFRVDEKAEHKATVVRTSNPTESCNYQTEMGVACRMYGRNEKSQDHF